MSQFITTEVNPTEVNQAEYIVWRRVETAWQNRNCLAYWRYPIFTAKSRREPDILIADLSLGLVIIEVKSLKIEQIHSINGHLWQYQDFYTDAGNPYQQAENQLFALLKYINPEPSLKSKITARVIIALPMVTQQSWIDKGFSQLPSNPPLLFREHLQLSYNLPEYLDKIPPVVTGKQLNLSDWQLLISILAGKSVLTQPDYRVLSHPESRGQILAKLRRHFFTYDRQQEQIAKQIPSGPQRIRGVPGSGKTILLTQKAALMHLKHPQWAIALVFFSRSLYSQIIEQVDQWLRYFSANQQGYSPNSSLQILHAWSLYKLLCQQAKVQSLRVSDTDNQSPQESLAEACVQLLQQSPIAPIFDAILIDEAQDLISQRWHYQQKQPFYWLAYQALHPVNCLHPQQRRLIWAYDQLQSLGSFHSLDAGELLGRDLAHLVTGSYPGGINKTEIMSRCYRTPAPLTTLAYGLAMGWLRPQGMLTGITTLAEWEAIGYRVEGDLIPNHQVTLTCEHTSHPLTQLWQKPLIEFATYANRQQELTALAAKIIHNLRHEGLRPSGQILIIILGDFFTASSLESYVARFLTQQGIDIYLPDGNQFWCEGAVTITRIHRAKGNEADLVYLVGLDHIAQAEDNLSLRNQLFVAITRSKAWLNLSGIGYYPLYQEVRALLNAPDKISFTFRLPQKQELSLTTVAELRRRYALGDRHFQNINLAGANLEGIYLSNANLIGANLSYANLRHGQLDNANLIAADLTGADLTGANLTKAKLSGAKLVNTILTDTDLTNTEMG